MIIPPSPMDLTTVAACQSWGSFGGTTNNNLQACLTAASIYFLRQTGRGPRNWQNTTQNPFNEPVPYSETYDGTSGNRLFLRNFPINSVSSLSVNNIAVPASQSTASPGYCIDDQGRSLAIRFGGGGASPDTFQYVGRFGNGYTSGYGGGRCMAAFGGGIQSVQVSYIAGFTTIPVDREINTILPAWQASTAYSTGAQISDGTFMQQCTKSGTSGVLAPPWSANKGQPTADGTGATATAWTNTGITQAPNTMQLTGDRAILDDDGVAYFSNGNPLIPVMTAPAVGQYFLIQQGLYLFNTADAGQEVMVSYEQAGTPADIVLAVIQLVSLNYKRRDWIGQRSVAMKDVGSTSYTLATDPGIVETIRNYTRMSLAS